ncbi:MAG: efflux RND transporter periplasmic adaptor subunit [Desulfomonile tiedjei]|uniref:Efflux RND transporter periplasmic adaptor subunit n=1 Tax=Desulfomonile tiedjei TaxID=2358 RepID=A0A9D6V2W4_9BACT|nr:efflux RND transporter periplasmic adaptor subunit [Desulfomonile tiedjei]
MTTKKILTAAIAVVGLIIVLMWSQGGFHSKVPGGRTASEAGKSGAPKTVKAELIRTAGQVTVSGTVVSKETARIAAKVQGYVVELNVDAGDKVKKGQALLRIDSKEMQERESQAKAFLESARADLVKARNDFERYKILFEKESISKKDYDDVSARYQTAQAADLRAQAFLDEAATMLSYATVTAPFDGIIGERDVNLGDLAAPGRALFSIYAPSTVELVAPVGEQYSPFLPAGAPVEVAVPSLGLKQASSIREVVPIRDEKTRTITVKAPFSEAPGLVPGLYGTLSFDTRTSEVIVVPLSAISSVGQLESARVLEDGQIKTRHVKTGRKLDDRVEILSGLTEGEQVVVE